MRQVQHGRKPRGRGRKQHNPLSRIYDSSGPDTKIRGTAAHIAEKYQSLARDATSSGHRIVAENYLQHAEHYLRIVAVAQAAMQPQAQMQGGNANTGQGDQAAPSERRDGDDDSGDAAQAGEGSQGQQGQRGEGGAQTSGRGRRGQRRRQPSFDNSAGTTGGATAGAEAPAMPDPGAPEAGQAPARVPEHPSERPPERKTRSAKAARTEDPSVNGVPAPDTDAEPGAPTAPRRRTRRKPKTAEDSPEKALATEAGTADVV